MIMASLDLSACHGDASAVVSSEAPKHHRIPHQGPLLDDSRHRLRELHPNIPPLQDLNPSLPPHVSAPCPPRIHPSTPYNHHFNDTYYQPSSAVSSLRAIPKLSSKNYRSWVTNVELVLRRHQVWAFVRDVPPPPNECSHAWY